MVHSCVVYGCTSRRSTNVERSFHGDQRIPLLPCGRNMSKVKGLRERLRDGEDVICAEGYMWELERRGYVRCGRFTPEVVLDCPERVISLHEEYIFAGTDVVEAYTYYGHREKLRRIGREDDLEKLNMAALKMAREVADRYGKLMAGNISNTLYFDPNSEQSIEKVAAIFKEQVEWAVKGGADYIIGETFNDFTEAKLALEAIQKYGNGLPAVITLTAYCPDITTDDIPIPKALRELEKLGADVVGLNCGRGPATMLPLLREARKVCKGPMAALPVPFRTTDSEITFMAMKDKVTGRQLYPHNVACNVCTREEIRQFAKDARAIGINYIGLCCGSSSNLLREITQEYGRTPPASTNAPDFSHSIVSVSNNDNISGHVKKVSEFMLGSVRNGGGN